VSDVQFLLGETRIINAMPLPLILGMDIATSCGLAWGRPDERPKTMTWDLREGGKGRPKRLAHLANQCRDFFCSTQPDVLFYEAGMTLGVAQRIGTSDETFSFLRGAIGVVEASAVLAHIPFIEAVDVQEARKHLLGSGRLPKGEGKRLVFDRCKALRWPVANDDESDACAIWSLGCGKMNPITAHLTTPLFSGAPRRC
jgi:hypothetical protein